MRKDIEYYTEYEYNEIERELKQHPESVIVSGFNGIQEWYYYDGKLFDKTPTDGSLMFF